MLEKWAWGNWYDVLSISQPRSIALSLSSYSAPTGCVTHDCCISLRALLLSGYSRKPTQNEAMPSASWLTTTNLLQPACVNKNPVWKSFSILVLIMNKPFNNWRWKMGHPVIINDTLVIWCWNHIHSNGCATSIFFVLGVRPMKSDVQYQSKMWTHFPTCVPWGFRLV